MDYTFAFLRERKMNPRIAPGLASALLAAGAKAE